MKTASDVEVTELTELHAEKVSGVGKPANGTSFLLVKAAADDDDACSTCDGKGTIMEGNRKCPDCSGATKSDSDEADEIEAEVTKEWEALDKALSAADRKKMPTSSFAYVDKKGGKHLPIHDDGHVKAALGRFNQQDFSEAKGDPTKAKAAAASKIKTAAGKHGIEVSDDSNVAEAAKKGAVQDALGGTTTPAEGGHLATGQSGLAGPVTSGLDIAPADASFALGGKTPYAIPDEAKVQTNPPAPTTTDAFPGLANPQAVAKGVASLVEAMDVLGTQRQAIKDGKYLQVDNPLLSQTVDPGSAPWESYDSATLAQVAQCLAGCCNALDSIQQREAVEAASGNPQDKAHSWDLEDAASALRCAMGIAARIAFEEAAEGSVEKAGRVVSDKNMKALETAHKHLATVIDGAKTQKAGDAGDDSEEEKIQMEVTKSEFVSSVREILKAERKAERKAAKRAAAEEASKNANNDGDVTVADVKATSEHDANDVQSVGGSVDATYVNKGEADGEPDPVVKQLVDQFEELTKGLRDRLESVEGVVTKIAKRPRSGGPSLDGQARGLAPAAEGRQGDVTKSTADTDIESLEKSLDEATDPVLKSELGLKLTYARLLRAHEEGRL